jgi:hypothetical protein
MDHPLAGWAQTSNEPVRNPEYRQQVRGLIVAHGLAGEPESDLADDETRTGESDRSAPNGGEDGQ